MLILCAYYPYMRISYVYAHIIRICIYTYIRICDPPRWSLGTPAPALRHCKTYYKSSILHPARTQRATHADLGGRRTSPACGSFRRPLNYNAGMN